MTLKVLDKDGAVVPAAKQPIRFSIEGPGEIVATDNGDPTDMTAFPSLDRNAFNGLALAIVRATGSGRIILHAEGEGLEQASVHLLAKR